MERKMKKVEMAKIKAKIEELQAMRKTLLTKPAKKSITMKIKGLLVEYTKTAFAQDNMNKKEEQAVFYIGHMLDRFEDHVPEEHWQEIKGKYLDNRYYISCDPADICLMKINITVLPDITTENHETIFKFWDN